jgi:hypothetical protein
VRPSTHKHHHTHMQCKPRHAGTPSSTTRTHNNVSFSIRNTPKIEPRRVRWRLCRCLRQAARYLQRVSACRRAQYIHSAYTHTHTHTHTHNTQHTDLAAALAASVAPATAIPTSAALSAGASLTPSPVIATRWPCGGSVSTEERAHNTPDLADWLRSCTCA